MSYINKILILVFFMSTSFLYAQTPGMNYQAIILNNATIEIPGTDVKENQVPLGLTEVTFRFSISNENEIEYTEDQTVMTDENGMISLIVGEGTPVYASFDDILWDGKLKYLNVEINILSNNEGFVFLDTQKILYIPHSTNGVSGVTTVDTIDEMTPPYRNGDLVWVENHGENNMPTLMIYNGTEWIPVTDDFDPTNELNLVVVADTATRDIQFNQAKVGDQVWNQNCNCMQVYDGTNWVSVGTGGLTVVANETDRDNQFNPAIVGDQVWNQDCNCMQVYDGTNWVSVGTGTGNLAIIPTVSDLNPSAVAGDLAWVEAFGDDNIPTLMIYNGTDWVPVNSDFDPRNELDLTVVANETVRDTQFNPAIVGNQVWNQDCNCMQVYDGTNWVSVGTGTGNLTVVADDTARDTQFNPATAGDQVWNQDCVCMQVYDGTNWVSVGTGSGVTVVADDTARDTEFNPATAGDQVWNQDCVCMQVYDGTNWVSVGTGGLTVVANDTARDTEFNPAIVGDQVWNQDCNCMQVYDGTNWVSVGPATGNVAIAPTVSDLDSSAVAGDLAWVETFGDDNIPTLMIYNGTDWVPVNSDFDPRNELDLTVVANETVRDTQFNPAIVGNQVWNQDCGCMQVYDGTNWISTSTITGASNGLNVVDNTTIKLGGILTNPTVITTSTTNTLAIKDLEVSTVATDELVMIEQSTGVLRRRSLTTLVQQEQIIITGNIGQLRFTTPLPITDLDKIDVYRNGARISFVMIDATTIELEPEAICYQGDEIRIVQLN